MFLPLYCVQIFPDANFLKFFVQAHRLAVWYRRILGSVNREDRHASISDIVDRLTRAHIFLGIDVIAKPLGWMRIY